jgi:hypothetical protein
MVPRVQLSSERQLPKLQLSKISFPKLKQRRISNSRTQITNCLTVLGSVLGAAGRFADEAIGDGVVAGGLAEGVILEGPAVGGRVDEASCGPGNGSEAEDEGMVRSLGLAVY